MLGKLKKLILIIVVFAMLTFMGCASGYTEYSGVVFGSMEVSLKVDGGNSTIEKMLLAIEEVDNSVSLTKNSTLKKFNDAKANEDIEVDKHIFAMFAICQTLVNQTSGAFNPTVGAVSTAWGVDNEGISKYCYGNQTPNSLPNYQYLQSLREITSLDNIVASKVGDRYFLKKTTDGVTLDFGGIAKGYCADLLKSIAQQDKVDSALISISGNLMLIGNNNDTKTEWRVGVKHPRPKEQQYVCGLTISDRSVVTSGDYERFYNYDGLRINHVINPLTLCPVGINYDNGYKQSNSFVTSATIVGESSLLCDAYSTAVMVLGATEGAALLQSVGYSGIIFTSDYKYVVVGELSFISSQTAYKTEYEQL